MLRTDMPGWYWLGAPLQNEGQEETKKRKLYQSIAAKHILRPQLALGRSWAENPRSGLARSG